MLIDAIELDNNTVLETDLCIIGAGAAGISIALDWLNRPEKVILLESGGFEYEQDVQSLNDGETSGQAYYPLQSCRLRQFGGTTALWAGMCTEFDEWDFKQRDWVPNSGWGIQKTDLAHYYAKAKKLLKLMSDPQLTSYLEAKYSAPKISSSNIWNKIWQHSKVRFATAYRSQIETANNITLVTHASVVNILCNQSISTATEVTVKNHAGKTHKVQAKHFILACGAIQNARLLLASKDQTNNGLGNDLGLVGRYFMEHLEVDSAQLWLSNRINTEIYIRQGRKNKVSAELGISEAVQKKYKMLNGTVSLTPLDYADNIKPRIQTWHYKDPRKSMRAMLKNWSSAAKFVRSLPNTRSNQFQLTTRLEQAPNPNSRIQLLGTKDSLGLAKVKLHWQLSSLEKQSIRSIHDIISKEFGLLGLGRLKLENFLRTDAPENHMGDLNGGWHHMGTTRMSERKTHGVVNLNCKVHGITNLSIAGSSCFPTSGSANPTLTLIALSLRLSDHLKKQITTR